MESARKNVLQLARSLLVQSTSRWIPEGYDAYENAVSEFMREEDKEAVTSFISDIDGMGARGETDRSLALIPALLGFLGRFGQSADLNLVACRNCVGAGGQFLEKARELLKRAYAASPESYHVLWELWVSYPEDWFPGELRLAPDDLEHERECLRRILSISPRDDLAVRVSEWIDRHRRPYNRSPQVPAPVWEIAKDTHPLARKSLHQLLDEVDP